MIFVHKSLYYDQIFYANLREITHFKNECITLFESLFVTVYHTGLHSFYFIGLYIFFYLIVTVSFAMITVPYNALIADKSHYSQRGSLVLRLLLRIYFSCVLYISCINLLNSSFRLETSFRRFRIGTFLGSFK